MLDKSANLNRYKPHESLDTIRKSEQLIAEINRQRARIEWLKLQIALLLNSDN